MYVVMDFVTGVTTQGKTIEEAIENIKEAVELYLEELPEMKEFDRDINGSCWDCLNFLEEVCDREFYEFCLSLLDVTYRDEKIYIYSSLQNKYERVFANEKRGHQNHICCSERNWNSSFKEFCE